MSDPYATLGEQLAAAAAKASTPSQRAGVRRPSRSRPLRLALAAVVLVLVGSAAGVAATGFLEGSPVRPEPQPNRSSGNGVPVPSAHPGITIEAPDPAGGLSWGLRVLHTTRGQVCVQVGRVQRGELGELGLDSGFGNDGRFHELVADVLPPGYGGGAGQIECVGAAQTVVFEDSQADRSAMRLLPEEFAPPHAPRVFPPVADLRALTYGLLGEHAVSVTYRTPAGLRTAPVHAADGAFLIVEPAGKLGAYSAVGGSIVGEATPRAVSVIFGGLARLKRIPVVTAVTFRFGSHLCSQGVGAHAPACPSPRRNVPRTWFRPTKSLHQPVGLKLVPQSRPACKAAFLLYPCFKGLVSFTAPYAVVRAGSEYAVETLAHCKVGGRPESDWGLDRNIRAHALVGTLSLGLFVYTPSCVPDESFRVSYLNPRGPSHGAPHASIIIGSVPMRDATPPSGASHTR